MAAAVAATAVAVFATSAAAALAPFGHTCVAEHGVRFCPTATLAQRVPSFDGTPLDVDVTLPAHGRGPFPTIVMLHAWGGEKTSLESTTAAGDSDETYDYNNVYYAEHGFAVVNYSARGWGRSCGTPQSRTEPACADGFSHIADQRYEARDTQFLLGVLVDERIAKPGHLGVTGVSYGGGQALELAYLRNHIRLPDGSFAEWRSPDGTPLAIDAAWARWPWSDLVAAEWPNGRFLEGGPAAAGQSREPIGVELQDWVSGLAAFAEENAFLAPAGSDPEAELPGWDGALRDNEPYGEQASAALDRIYAYHQAYGLPGKPARLLLQSGWTDSLFPVEQSLRVYESVLAQHGQVALQVGDLGHSPAANKPAMERALDAEGARFFAAWLRARGKPPRSGSVTAYTVTCPESAPAGGPYTAASWAALHPAHMSFGAAAAQTFSSEGAQPSVSTLLNPAVTLTEPCQTLPVQEPANVAAYTTTSGGFTLLGLPTITASVKLNGPTGEIAARLWDVIPGAGQRLIDRGVYRLSEGQQGKIVFQLHGDGYRFARGDTVKLELLGADAPYYRATRYPFSVEVSNVSVSLPTTGAGTSAAETSGAAASGATPARSARARGSISTAHG